MGRVLGRHAGLLTAALIGLVVIGPLAAFAPLAGALTLGALAAAVAGLALARAAANAARGDKLSGEIDGLSRRLLALDTAAAAPARPDARRDALAAEIDDLTVEIGLLSGIVRDLAAVVRTQDGEIARLREVARDEPARALPPPDIPVEAPPAPRPDPAPRAAPPAPLSAAAPAPPPASSPPAPPPTRAAVPPPRPIPPRPEPAAHAILRAFEGEGTEIHLQPVVTLPQRKVVAYEAMARLRVEARLLEPDEFLPVLERDGRTTELDRRMLARAGTVVRHLARRGSEAGVTYALSPLSLFEPGFLRELGRMVADEPALSGLTVAVDQESWRGLDAGQRALLGAMRGRIGFSLDRPGDLRFDAPELAGHGVRQVRVPAALLLHPERAGVALSDLVVEDLAPALGRAGIRLVATGVEAEGDVPDLIDLDVPLAQGSAFAPARPVRAEVVAAPPDDPAPPPGEPGAERRPFRSFLRRAV